MHRGLGSLLRKARRFWETLGMGCVNVLWERRNGQGRSYNERVYMLIVRESSKVPFPWCRLDIDVAVRSHLSP